MDYNFFVHRIGTIPDELLQSINQRVDGLADSFQTSTPNFRQHSGFSSIHSSHDNPVANDISLELAPLVAGIFPVRNLAEYDLNLLAPAAIIPEHTDMTGPQNVGWRVNRGHKIHFVLKGSGSRSSHRRSKENDQREFRYEEGGIYVYNNYVFHSAWNAGAEDRIHFVLLYADHEWRLKAKLYARLKIQNWNF